MKQSTIQRKAAGVAGGFRSRLVLLILIISISIAGCDAQPGPSSNDPGGTAFGFQEKTDDWQYQPGMDGKSGGITYGQVAAPSLATGGFAIGESSQKFSSDDNMGFSVGGAKDINNFRENIKNGYLPLPTDVTYEGLFYNYYFDTGRQHACDKLFCPSYAYAVTADPISSEVEYYLAVGLNSGLKESDFERKKLNLVVVLDISGSMSSAFNNYYYDQFGSRVESDINQDDRETGKIEVAAESVISLLDHLNDDDRFGMVLFNNEAFLAKPLNLVGETDMKSIKDHILDLSAGGGTNMSSGMKVGTELFDEVLDADRAEYENRIIFLTDAMPNMGEISEHGLLGMTEKNADLGLYTSFIGIGVDFNTELIELITKIKGANYYAVHSAGQFRERMNEEFEYMVTPLVFDLKLELEGDGWEIEAVYGSPEADEATGEIMKVNTLFPSRKVEGETKGGLVLLKLNKRSAEGSLVLRVSYEDREGKKDSSEVTIVLQNAQPELFENTGIRKGILLSRYADLLMNWLIDQREHAHFSRPWGPKITEDTGIICPLPIDVELGKWERQSLPLEVSEDYEDLFDRFFRYFESEMNGIGDADLSQELEVMQQLLD